MEKSLDRKLAKWGITESEKRLILNRIDYTQDLRELSKADLLVEATLDHLDIKYELLRTADQLCRREVFFLSATSTLKVSDLAKEINRGDMLVGLHFIPPVPDAAVAELVRGVRTSDQAVEVAKAFAARLGKQVVEIEESQGLVNPRALVAMINEAAYLLDEGVCEAKDAELIFREDRKSTRLNSSHVRISYAVFCLKKKTTMKPVVVLVWPARRRGHLREHDGVVHRAEAPRPDPPLPPGVGVGTGLALRRIHLRAHC